MKSKNQHLTTPMFQNSFENETIFLGHYVGGIDHYDLYFCPLYDSATGSQSAYTLVARFGDAPEQYSSSPHHISPPTPPLIEALRLATAKNLIISPTKGVGMFPTIDIWNRWIQKKEKAELKSHLFEDLDLSKWEDRLILFCRVSNNCPLEIDKRPKFSSHMKVVKERIISEGISSFEEYRKMWDREIPIPVVTDDPDYYEERFQNLIDDGWTMELEDNRGGTFSSTSGNFTCIAHLSYHALYPTEEFVKPTQIGKCANKYYNSADKAMVKDYFKNLLTEFCAKIELLYQASVSLKEQGEELFLLKSQINWQELFSMRDRIDILFWYYREWEGFNLIGEIHDPYEGKNEHWNYTEFIVDWVFFLLTKAYGIHPKEYKVRSPLLNSWVWWCADEKAQPDCDSFLDDDNEDWLGASITDCTLYRTYVSKYGTLCD